VTNLTVLLQATENIVVENIVFENIVVENIVAEDCSFASHCDLVLRESLTEW
jgi:hypothetical protein